MARFEDETFAIEQAGMTATIEGLALRYVRGSRVDAATARGDMRRPATNSFCATVRGRARKFAHSRARLGNDREQSRQCVPDPRRARERDLAAVEAVARYSDAFTERTRKRVPVDWAMSFGNQGIAMTVLAARSKDERMAEIAC
jgi:hypothetical protein